VLTGNNEISRLNHHSIATIGSNSKFAPSRRHRGGFCGNKNTNLLLFGGLLLKDGHNCSGDLLLSNKKRKKAGLSRERGINGHVRERLAGLCRESPLLPWLRGLPLLLQMISVISHK